MGIYKDVTAGKELAANFADGELRLLDLARGGSKSSIAATPIHEVRERLRTRRGLWRSFDEVLETQAFAKSVEDEFPERRSLLSLDRRDFLKFLGASTVMAGLAGCRNLPQEKIVPYVKAPEEFVPGRPIEYATSFVHAGFAMGVLVESHMGRPTKIEGNPDHPSSLGSTDAFAQAAVWGLYDPDRSQQIQTGKDIATWETFFTRLHEAVKANPSGFRILAETTTSPSLLAMLNQVQKKIPGAKVYHYEAAGLENAHEGARIAFGEAVQPVYDFARAKVIVTLDADPFAELPGRVRYARDFAAGRDPEADMNRVYAIESYPTMIGAIADHRAVVKPSKVEEGARALATAVGAGGGGGFSFAEAPWLAALVEDLNSNKGASLVVAGNAQPPAVHALAFGINAVLGNIGKTVSFIDPMIAGDMKHQDSLGALVEEAQAGQISTLLILGGNPVFTAPADYGFAEAISKIPFKARWGLTEDETSAVCDWHLPALHFLESWGDARAHDGTVSLIQPLIAPLYAGKSAHELLEGLLGGARRGHDIVKDFWASQAKDSGEWDSWLEKGVVPDSALPARTVAYREGSIPGPGPASSGLETVFLPDPTIWDGRYANCPWLQELPKPFTTLTWDNTVQLSPKTAEAQGCENHDVVEVELNGRAVRGPVWVTPGMADDTVVIHFGYGRTRTGLVGNGTGFNAFEILPKNASSYMGGVSLKKVGSNFPLASAQNHNVMEGRDIARSGNLADLESNPSLAPANAYRKDQEIDRNLYTPEEFAYDGYKWAMAIDLSRCIGCNACVLACQTENNIPSVGKEQVIRGRELHWIRIDRYYKGELDQPSEILFQPLTCMHCEQAPCEPVCPVAATTHSKEGLNQMVYNRCVGTRYCSNNCPYKVRRFNYINFGDRLDYPSTEDVKKSAPTIRLMQNPDVTVRGRGVMEKCTYCVQRINAARIEAKKHDREIKDGEIVPACAQACPTKTIVFGNIADPNSAVSKARANGRNYALLEELNTIPRTTYLGKVRNPNPNA